MAEKKQTLTTRRMPSGAQQYTREGRRSALIGGNTPPLRRMRMIHEDLIRRHPEAETALHEAFMDEARLSRAATQNQMQAQQDDNANRRPRKFAEGGMVRGTRPVQMSGKGFSGSY